MLKVFLVSLSALLFISCSSSEDSGPAQADCNCIPGEKVTSPVDIDKMREELAEKWTIYSPDQGTVEDVLLNEAGIYETDDNGMICEYLFNKIRYVAEYKLNESESGDAEAYWSVFRELKDYKLGSATTEDPSVCHSNASIVDDEAAAWQTLFALLMLVLDKDLDDGGKSLSASLFSRSTVLKSFSTQEMTFTAKEMIKGTVNGLEMYMLTYDVHGVEGFTGTYSVRFGAKHSPMAYVWSDEIKGTYQGQPISERANYITTVDGITVN